MPVCTERLFRRFCRLVGKGTKNFGIFETFWTEISRFVGYRLGGGSHCAWLGTASIPLGSGFGAGAKGRLVGTYCNSVGRLG